METWQSNLQVCDDVKVYYHGIHLNLYYILIYQIHINIFRSSSTNVYNINISEIKTFSFTMQFCTISSFSKRYYQSKMIFLQYFQKKRCFSITLMTSGMKILECPVKVCEGDSTSKYIPLLNSRRNTSKLKQQKFLFIYLKSTEW